MNFRILNRLFQLPKRFLTTSGLELKQKNVIDLNNKLSTPKYFDYFNSFLTEQDYRKFVSKESIFRYNHALKEYKELFEIVTDAAKKDEVDFIALAQTEAVECLKNLEDIQTTILSQAIHDDRDVSNCTFEVRSGVGGKEASIFAEEIAQLYLKFFTLSGWDIRFNKEQFEQVEINDSSSLEKYAFEVSGPQSYKLLRHEAGIHRVQRIPKTEKYGRIHTSTISISVIPIRKNLVEIKDADLRFSLKNATGSGGQNVNRVLTCVRCTHIPTGLTVESQETRCQNMNRETSIKKITALVNQMEFDRLENEIRSQRKVQIGIASRSDKIRTYNYPQDRITDHRIGSAEMLHNIIGYIAGEQATKMRGWLEKLEEIRHNELVQQLRAAIQKDFHKKF